MVNLADERELLICHPFGEVKLPERTASVQRGAGHLTDDLVELPPPAGSRYVHSPEVVVKVDIALLEPHRVMQPPRDVDELVAQRLQQGQPFAECPTEQLVTELTGVSGGVDDRNLQGMGMQVGCLAVEQ